VVGAAVGGIPEIIDDKKTGLLFKPNNPEDLAEKITILLTDKKLCKELGQKAYEKVHENLTWQASMSRLISKITGLKHE
jgi:glycosyltransferase involved in cell wall biosynthesis